LEGWDRQNACPSWTGLVQAECLSQRDRVGTGTWYRHAVCTKPVPLGQGKVERDLSPVPGTGHVSTLEAVPVPGTGSIPTLEACPCPGTGSIPMMEPVPVQPVPTCPIKWDYKAVQYSQKPDLVLSG